MRSGPLLNTTGPEPKISILRSAVLVDTEILYNESVNDTFDRRLDIGF